MNFDDCYDAYMRQRKVSNRSFPEGFEEVFKLTCRTLTRSINDYAVHFHVSASEVVKEVNSFWSDVLLCYNGMVFCIGLLELCRILDVPIRYWKHSSKRDVPYLTDEGIAILRARYDLKVKASKNPSWFDSGVPGSLDVLDKNSGAHTVVEANELWEFSRRVPSSKKAKRAAMENLACIHFANKLIKPEAKDADEFDHIYNATPSNIFDSGHFAWW
jgi:hypothetical protein